MTPTIGYVDTGLATPVHGEMTVAPVFLTPEQVSAYAEAGLAISIRGRWYLAIDTPSNRVPEPPPEPPTPTPSALEEYDDHPEPETEIPVADSRGAGAE